MLLAGGNQRTFLLVYKEKNRGRGTLCRENSASQPGYVRLSFCCFPERIRIDGVIQQTIVFRERTVGGNKWHGSQRSKQNPVFSFSLSRGNVHTFHFRVASFEIKYFILYTRNFGTHERQDRRTVKYFNVMRMNKIFE